MFDLAPALTALTPEQHVQQSKPLKLLEHVAKMQLQASRVILIFEFDFEIEFEFERSEL